MQHIKLIGTLLSLVLLSACASQSDWKPTVDPYQPSSSNPYGSGAQGQPPADYYHNEELKNRYYRDLAECKELATTASDGTAKEATKGAATGALLGAAGGAVIGAITGSAGTGAAIGAAAGGLGGGTKGGLDAEEQYKRAYSNCMRRRGHNVVN